YKNKGAFKEEARRNRRNEQQVEIRRQKRDENISKRRNLLSSARPNSDEEVGAGVSEPLVCSFNVWSTTPSHDLPRTSIRDSMGGNPRVSCSLAA
ncbi:hypothetical protein B0H13DRAFT_1994296, partial [Mycena leptocephala]